MGMVGQILALSSQTLSIFYEYFVIVILFVIYLLKYKKSMSTVHFNKHLEYYQLRFCDFLDSFAKKPIIAPRTCDDGFR